MAEKKVFVFPGKSAVDRDRLVEILDGIECVALVAEMADADVVVVLIDAQTMQIDPEELAGAATARYRLVGVYGSGGNLSVPSVLEQLGDAFIPMDRNLLIDVICNDATLWLDETGDEWTPPETDRECSVKGC